MLLLRLVLVCVSLSLGAAADIGAADIDAADAPIRMIDPDHSRGTSAAVSVSKTALAHTSLLLPVNTAGQVVGDGRIQTQMDFVIANLEKVLELSKSSIGQVVQMNVCVKHRADLPAARAQIAERFREGTPPAVTFFVGTLPEPDALVGMDVVAVSAWESINEIKTLVHSDVFHRKNSPVHVSIVPWGEAVYLSGWIDRTDDDLPSALDATLAFQESLLASLEGGLDDIVRIRVFLNPKTQQDAVERAIAKFFHDQTRIPPVVYTPWGLDRTPEIEWVARGRASAAPSNSPSIEYVNVPGLAASPVFCRATRVRSDSRVYLSGLTGSSGQSDEQQVRDIFQRLQVVLEKAGSDMNHLVKATYVLGNSDASRALTAVRRELFDSARAPAASGFQAEHPLRPNCAANVDMIAVPVLPEKEQDAPDLHSQSEGSFQLRPGFRMELVASEPLLRDPVAITFDENGRLFVIEYPEYNQHGVNADVQDHGQVRLLEDVDGDGRFDQSSVYLSGLHSPSAIFCYDGGVFVAAAPDVLYCKDTDGDGKADLKQTVFTGFVRMLNRTDPSLNSFRWGLNNRIHACTSFSGGSVRVATEPESESQSIRNRGFQFDPRTRQFDLCSGGGQHGLAADEWGHHFLCKNSSPIRALMYDDRYVARNPWLNAPEPAVEITEDLDRLTLHRISPEEPWRVQRTKMRLAVGRKEAGGRTSGFFTAASGVTVYRGDAWPAAYRGDVFVAEPANNLVFQAKLIRDGLTWTARRADEKSEFLASTDTRFRPVQFADGPDGNLYVVDMSRDLIEGTMFLPPELLQQMDPTAGVDRGRIYRIVPDNHQSRKSPKLGAATTTQLVEYLEHPNGWHRDTAARLLYQQRDLAAVAPLRHLVTESTVPVARMTAMYALLGLDALDADTILRAMGDDHAEVRCHAIQLAEDRLESSSALRAGLLDLVDDPEITVRYQLAFSLGELPSSASRNQALTRLIVRDLQNPWMRMAVSSSLRTGVDEVFAPLLSNSDFRQSPSGQDYLRSLAQQVGSANRDRETVALIRALETLPETENELRESIVLSLLKPQRADARRRLLDPNHPSGQTLGRLLDDLITRSSKQAMDAELSTKVRVQAVERLRFAGYGQASVIFARLLDPRQPASLQKVALESLSQFSSPKAAELLVQRWPVLTPSLRSVAVEILVSRKAWSVLFLDAIEHGIIGRGDLDPARIELLKQHPDKALASRTRQLFSGAQLSGRNAVVRQYQSALQLDGDAAKGKVVFKQTCSACHRLGGIGNEVGADLKAIGDQGKASILLNILDPNREVKPEYQSYSLMTDAGRVISGMITDESVNHLTIRRADGTQASVLRVNIEQLKSSGISFMPEGLEKQIDPQSMADLLAYLMSHKVASVQP